MSARKSSNSNSQLSFKSGKWRIIAYSIAAIVAVVGAVLGARGIASGFSAIGVAFWIALFTYLIGVEQKRKQADERNARLGMIKLSRVAAEYQGKAYRTIVSAYERLGFHNVTAVNLHDLHRVVLNKPGSVETVTIDGKKVGVNEWYHPDAEVRITYHGFSE